MNTSKVTNLKSNDSLFTMALVILTVCIMADVFLTREIIGQNFELELNPLARSILYNTGYTGLAIFKLFVITPILIIFKHICRSFYAKFLVYTVTLMSLILVVSQLIFIISY